MSIWHFLLIYFSTLCQLAAGRLFHHMCFIALMLFFVSISMKLDCDKLITRFFYIGNRSYTSYLLVEYIVLQSSSHLHDGRSYPIFYHKSITVDDTEKLCYPKGRTFIGGQSIASTFLCSSAVCLLIG